MLALREIVTLDMAMDDGVRLKADVYRPAGPGRHPVLAMRQPYGRKIGSTVVLAHPAWYAAQGFVVLVQDVRGRGGSEGRFRVLEDDVADGARTLALAAELEGGDGQVASYGFSYHGMNQYMALAGALARGTRRPDAMAIVMAAWDVRDDWAYEGGAFRLDGGQMWARQMGVDNARRAGDIAAAERLAAAGALHGGPFPARPELLQAHTHYAEWLADDPLYWRRVSPSARLAGLDLDVPVLHVGGFNDIMLTGTLAAHRAFADSKLILGPWAHIPWGRRLGGLDGGDAAADGIDREIVAFFNHRLKGYDDVLPAVRLFDTGARTWTGFSRWPQTRPLALHLASTGRAAASGVDGLLQETPCAFADRLVHDPWRPAPALGGPLGTPGLFADRAVADHRGDVLTYTGAPLEAPLTLAGEPLVELCVTSAQPSFDLSLALSFVRPDGAAIHVTGAHLTLDRPPAGPVRMNLRPTFFTVPAGARLRLSIQAAAFPAFAVNPGTGQRAVDAHCLDAVVTTLTIASPARLELPVLADAGEP
jgi:putative CocE/NonD family hydrolase